MSVCHFDTGTITRKRIGSLCNGASEIIRAVVSPCGRSISSRERGTLGRPEAALSDLFVNIFIDWTSPTSSSKPRQYIFPTHTHDHTQNIFDFGRAGCREQAYTHCTCVRRRNFPEYTRRLVLRAPPWAPGVSSVVMMPLSSKKAAPAAPTTQRNSARQGVHMGMVEAKAKAAHLETLNAGLETRVGSLQRLVRHIMSHLEPQQLRSLITAVQASHPNYESTLRNFASMAAGPVFLQLLDSKDPQTDEEGQSSGRGVTKETVNPMLASAKDLLRWADKQMKMREDRVSKSATSESRTSSKVVSFDSLEVSELKLQLKTMQEVLVQKESSNRALLDRAIVAEQRAMFAPTSEVSAKVLQAQLRGKNAEISRAQDIQRQSEVRCRELEKLCEELRQEVERHVTGSHQKEAEAPSVAEPENSPRGGSIANTSQVEWLRAELRTCRRQILKLRALLSVKDEKISLLKQFREVPNRNSL